MPIPLEELTNTQTGGVEQVNQFDKIEKVKPAPQNFNMGSDKMTQEIQQLEQQNQQASTQIQNKTAAINAAASAQKATGGTPVNPGAPAVVNDEYAKSIYGWAIDNGRTKKSYDQFKSDWFNDPARTKEFYDKMATTAKFQELPFSIGSYEDFTGKLTPSKKANTNVRRAQILSGMDEVKGSVEKTTNDGLNTVSDFPTTIEEVGVEPEAVPTDTVPNPVATAPDADQVLSGADLLTGFNTIGQTLASTGLDAFDKIKNQSALNPLETFRLTPEYNVDNLKVEVPKLQTNIKELKDFIALGEDWKKNHSNWPQDKLDAFAVLADKYKDKYDSENSGMFLDKMRADVSSKEIELHEKQTLLTGEPGKPLKDPFEKLSRNALQDVNDNLNDPKKAVNYELERQKWIRSKKYTEEQINLAEQKHALEKNIMQESKNLYDPKKMLNYDTFFANKKKIDEAAWKVHNEHYIDFANKTNKELETSMAGLRDQYVAAAKNDIKTGAAQINTKYKTEFDKFLSQDQQAQAIAAKYKNSLYSADPQAKQLAQKQYKQELSQLPGYNKIVEAQTKELNGYQDGIIKKYDGKIQSEYRTAFTKAETKFKDQEKEWISKIYDPKALNKASLLDWKEGMKQDVHQDIRALDFSSKQKYLKEQWGKYMRHLAATDATMAQKLGNTAFRNQAEKEFYFSFADQMVDKQGKMTPYAIKTWASSQLENAKEQLDLVEKQKSKVTETDLREQDTDALVSAGEKRRSLRTMIESLEEIVDHPESDEGYFSDFAAGFTSNKFIDYLPLISTLHSIDKGWTIKASADDLAAGKTLRPEQQGLLNSLAAQKEMNQLRPTSTSYNVGKGIAETLPAIGEFVLSNGAFTTTKAATKKIITNQIAKSVEKSFEKNVAKGLVQQGAKDKFVQEGIKDLTEKGMIKYTTEGLSTFLGAMAQTSANPQQIIDKMIQRMTPQVKLMYTDAGNKIEAQIESMGEDPGEAFLKATGSSFSEFFTERLGGHVMKAGDKTLKALTNNSEWLKRSMIGSWMVKRGIKNPETAMDVLIRDKIGWNGIIEENMEEWLNHGFDAVITGDHSAVMSGQEGLETFLTTSILGGGLVKPVRYVGGKIVNGVKDVTHTQNLVYSKTNPDGSQDKSLIQMPRMKWNEYVKMMNKPLTDEDGLNRFLDKLDIDEKHKDALKENYYTTKRPEAEAKKEVIKTKQTEVPAPEQRKEEYGFSEFIKNPDIAEKSPISNVPIEVAEMAKETESTKEVEPEQLHDVEKWSKQMRETVVNNNNISEEEKDQSLDYLNNVIATTQAKYETTKPEEEGAKPKEKVSPEDQQANFESVKSKKLVKAERETEKIKKARRIVSKPLAAEASGEFESAIDSFHSISPIDTEYKDVKTKMDELQSQLKIAQANPGGGSKAKNLKSQITRLQPKLDDALSALNEVKTKFDSDLKSYAFKTGVDPKKAFLDVKHAQIEPVSETIKVAPVTVEEIKQKQTAKREGDIARLDSPETFEEAIDDIKLDKSEIDAVKAELKIDGDFETTSDLFNAYKESNGDTGTFYDTAKKARIETVRQKEEARNKPIEEAKKREEERKTETTKAAAAGTIIDSKKKVVSEESVAVKNFNKQGTALEKQAAKQKNPTIKKFMDSIARVMMSPKSFDPGVKIGEVTKVKGEFYQVALKDALAKNDISQADFDYLNKMYYDYRQQLDQIKNIRENPDLNTKRFYAQQVGSPSHIPGVSRIQPSLHAWKDGESEQFSKENTVSKLITKFSNQAKLLTVFTRGAKKGSPKGMYDATQRILFLIDKGVNNMDIYSHEFGHHIDTLYGLTEKAKALQDSDYKTELFKEFKQIQGSGPTQTFEDIIEESMAELGRAMIVNPTAVNIQYPLSYVFFNQNVDKQMRGFLNEMGDSFRKAYSLSDMEKGILNLSMDGKTTAEIKNVGSFLNNTTFVGQAYIKFAKYFLNKNYPLIAAMRQLGALTGKDFTPEESFETLFRLFAGNNQKINSFLKFGLRDAKLNIVLDGNKAKTFGWLIGEDVLDFNNEEDLQYVQKQLFAYMLAKRTVEMAENKYARDVFDVTQDFAAAKDKAKKTSENQLRYANDGEMISMFHAVARNTTDKEIVKNLEVIQKKYERKRDQIQKENQTELDALNKEEIDEINKIARQEMGLTGIGTGFETELELANSIIDTVETKYKATNQKLHDQIKELSRRYKSYSDDVLKYAMESGRISEEDYNKIKASNSEYVALKRINDLSTNFIDDADTILTGKKSSIKSSKDVTKKIKGSRKEVINPYIGLLDNVHTILQESDRNKVMMSGVDMFEEVMKIDPEALSGFVVKNPDETKIPKGRESFKVFRDGKEEKWYFVDPYIQELFTVLQRDENMVWKVMSFIPNIIRSLITSTPTFAIRNFLRDWQDRFLQSKTSSSFGGFSKYKETEAAFGASGGSQTMYYSAENYHDVMKKITDGILRKKDGALNILFSPKKWRPRGWYLDKLRYSEQSNRVAEYNNAYTKYESKYYQRFKQEALDDKKANGEPLELTEKDLEGITNQARYNAMLSAGLDARDLLDFAVAGKWIETINRVVPFTNAGIQGQKRFYKALMQGKGTVVKMAMYSILAELAFKSIQGQMGDDDEYAELPDYEKDMFWMIKAAPNTWIRVPKPYESAVFGNITNRVIDYVTGADEYALDGEYFNNWFATYAWKKTAGTVATNPFAANSVIDLMFLYDSFRNQQIVDSEESQKLLRKRHNYGKEFGNWTSNKVMEFASSIGLNSDYLDAKSVDFAAKTLFGEWGQLVNGIINEGVGQEKGQGLSLKTTKFVSESPATYGKSISKAHDLQKEYGLNFKEPEIRFEKVLKDEYYNAKTNEEKDAAAVKLRDFGRKLRKEYEFREENFTNKETGEAEVNPRDMKSTDAGQAYTRMSALLRAIKK